MTQEDKELLLKDLSSRLPYGVKVNNEIQGDFTVYGICENFIYGRSEVCHIDFAVEKIKPYLFPLSSMTEEQKEELNRITDGKFNSYGTYIDNCKPRNWNEWGTTEYNWIRHHDVDLLNMWLDKNHFDYRGLIPMGLAKDATGLGIY